MRHVNKYVFHLAAQLGRSGSSESCLSRLVSGTGNIDQ